MNKLGNKVLDWIMLYCFFTLLVCAVVATILTVPVRLAQFCMHPKKWIREAKYGGGNE